MKPKLICIFFLSLFSVTILNAKRVEPSNVKKVAINVFTKQAGIDKDLIRFAEIIPVMADGEEVYTIFNLLPRGHIIISNDDVVDPVLGYGLNFPY